MPTSELVEVKYSAEENNKLGKSFQEFYKLSSAPPIAKILIVDKAEYNKFLKSRTKIRTQFEPKEDEIDLSFENMKVPFEFVATKTEFLMPSGKILTLYEELDAPCGLTKLVTSTFNGETLTFQSYFQAEGYALAKYLEEIK